MHLATQFMTDFYFISGKYFNMCELSDFLTAGSICQKCHLVCYHYFCEIEYFGEVMSQITIDIRLKRPSKAYHEGVSS